MKKREAVFQPEFIEDLRYWVELSQANSFFTTKSTMEHDGKSLSSVVSLRSRRGEGFSNQYHKLILRAFDLIDAILRDPFSGIGKPEPLKYIAPGCWSRRLTQEHRIVYLVRDERIDFLQARYHYGK